MLPSISRRAGSSICSFFFAPVQGGWASSWAPSAAVGIRPSVPLVVLIIGAWAHTWRSPVSTITVDSTRLRAAPSRSISARTSALRVIMRRVVLSYRRVLGEEMWRLPAWIGWWRSKLARICLRTCIDDWRQNYFVLKGMNKENTIQLRWNLFI